MLNCLTCACEIFQSYTSKSSGQSDTNEEKNQSAMEYSSASVTQITVTGPPEESESSGSMLQLLSPPPSVSVGWLFAFSLG